MAAMDRDDEDDLPIAAQDLRSFLTQRCIQSFMYLLAETRDLHTVGWLDRFVRPITVNNYWEEDANFTAAAGDPGLRDKDGKLGSKLLNFHGLGAMNTTLFPEWDSFFTSLLEQPDAVLMIHTPDDVGHRAYSDIEIDIEPARLCTRILSVREQIARELAKDLGQIALMGQLIFNSYTQNAKDRRDAKPSEGADEDEESYLFAFDRPGVMYINFDPREDDAFAPSPLRKGNFDLLYNLITQSAILHLLQSEDGVVVGEDVVQNMASQTFLFRFYQERLQTHFVGAQWYGKGDDFLTELFLGSPIIMPREGGQASSDAGDGSEGPSSFLEVEPMRIAEQILLKRDKLALEWAKVMEAVPSEHTDIRKEQLDRLTGVPKTEPTKIALDEEFQ
ncbi:hypothetical protein ACHAXT_010093 [Thalassiosira profunda]